MKRILPVAAAIACGLAILIDYFVADPQIDAVGAMLAEGVTILAAFALLLGILNIVGVHARRVASEKQGRWLSLVLIISLVVTLAVGVVGGGSGAFTWLFQNVYYPLQSTMTALLAFFVVSAVYRAFRLRNAEALILLVTSLLVLFAQLPLAETVSPYLVVVRDWIFAVPVTAAMRGIVLGTALGTMATSLRILLAVDQPYVG